MRSATFYTSILTVPPLVVAAFALTGARTEPKVERVDFGKTITATQPAYDARLAPAGGCHARADAHSPSRRDGGRAPNAARRLGRAA